MLIDGTAAEIFSGGRAMSFRFYAQGGAPAVAEGFGEGAVRMAEAALTGEE